MRTLHILQTSAKSPQGNLGLKKQLCKFTYKSNTSNLVMQLQAQKKDSANLKRAKHFYYHAAISPDSPNLDRWDSEEAFDFSQLSLIVNRKYLPGRTEIVEISVLACTDKGGESMGWIQREECLQLHNAPKKKKKRKKKICEALPFFQFTIPQSAGIKSTQRIYSKPDWQCSPMPCREIRLYPSNTARKTIALSPRNFPPRHQVSSRAQNMPSVPEQRTCQLNRKFAATKGGGTWFYSVRENSCPMQNVIKSISARSPWWKERLFASPSLLPPTVLARFLRRFVRFTRFFLLLTSPHTLPSSFTPVGVISPPPLQHPQCNSSRFLAAVLLGPAFPPPIKLQRCLPARLSAYPALNLLKLGPMRGPLLGSRAVRLQ